MLNKWQPPEREGACDAIGHLADAFRTAGRDQIAADLRLNCLDPLLRDLGWLVNNDCQTFCTYR